LRPKPRHDIKDSRPIASAADGAALTAGVLVVPPSQNKAAFPVLSNLANRHRAVPFTPDQFHYAFTNTLGATPRHIMLDTYGQLGWQSGRPEDTTDGVAGVPLQDRAIPLLRHPDDHPAGQRERSMHGSAVADCPPERDREHQSIGRPAATWS
jgi:hypothetical protein